MKKFPPILQYWKILPNWVARREWNYYHFGFQYEKLHLITRNYYFFGPKLRLATKIFFLKLNLYFLMETLQNFKLIEKMDVSTKFIFSVDQCYGHNNNRNSKMFIKLICRSFSSKISLTFREKVWYHWYFMRDS